MINFKPVSLSDKNWIEDIVRSDGTKSINYNFADIFTWNETYGQSVSCIGSRIIAKSHWLKNTVYSFPIGTGPVNEAIDMLIARTTADNIPLCLVSLDESHIQLLNDTYPGKFTFESNPNAFEYVYLAEKLASYSGKALHGKRNHCNNFEAQFKWSFESLCSANFNICRELLRTWDERNSSRVGESISNEYKAIIKALNNFDALSLDGGILFADGNPVGFSIGSYYTDNYFDVMFEKADIDINGAYPMVCREMVKLAMKKHPDIIYINREEDMGIESLRTSKLSYKPEFLIKKYNAIYKG